MNNRGFTLIELVISLFILVAVIIGVYTAFATLVSLGSGIKDRFIAAYLAQEGMEVIRNIRDYNWVKYQNDLTVGWLDGLAPGLCETGCQLDYTTGTGIDGEYAIHPYSEQSHLNLNSNGLYTYLSGIETKFRRKITVTPILEGSETDAHIARVVTEILWNDGRYGELKFETEEYLYNWY